jgi:hypothetical protein
MSFVVLEKNYSPLHIKIKHVGTIVSEPVLFVWEDTFSKNVRYTDQVHLNSNVEYFSTINKNISFFENGITFKVVSLKTYETIYKFDFKNISFLKGKNILYISQNGYTGYSYSARNYIYQLIQCGYNVQWDTRFASRILHTPTTNEEKLIYRCIDNKIEKPDNIIIHHTPESWLPTINSLKHNVRTYGLTTWETTGLHKTWVELINNSVDEVIVPSKFNLKTFKESGVNKKINLWYHDILPIEKKSVDINKLYNSFEIYDDGNFVKNLTKIETLIKSSTIYYNISQYTNRKNIDQLLVAFCNRFTKSDNVCLFIKTHLENFNETDSHTLRYKVHSVLKHFENHPNIIFCFENLTDDQLNKLHELGDVYFTLNRGEGFGLCTYTAKKFGNKVICGNFGAEKEFLDSNDVLLDYRLDYAHNLDDFNKFYIDEFQKCAYFDTEYVASKLRYYPKKLQREFNYQ